MSTVGANLAPGRRLLLHILEHTAQTDPERVYASIPLTDHPKDGYRDVTFLDLSRAVNQATSWLETKFGRSSTFETLAYIGPPDIRYFILVLAASHIGYKVNYTSMLTLQLTAAAVSSSLSAEQQRGPGLSVQSNQML